MAVNVRKRIREHLCGLVDPVFNPGDVHPTRVIDAREGEPYAVVFFSNGEPEYTGFYKNNTAELAVGFYLPYNDYTDDDLDGFDGQVLEIIEADPNIDLDGIVMDIQDAGFEYADPDDSPYIALFRKFSVRWEDQ